MQYEAIRQLGFGFLRKLQYAPIAVVGQFLGRLDRVLLGFERADDVEVLGQPVVERHAGRDGVGVKLAGAGFADEHNDHVRLLGGAHIAVRAKWGYGNLLPMPQFIRSTSSPARITSMGSTPCSRIGTSTSHSATSRATCWSEGAGEAVLAASPFSLQFF